MRHHSLGLEGAGKLDSVLANKAAMKRRAAVVAQAKPFKRILTAQLGSRCQVTYITTQSPEMNHIEFDCPNGDTEVDPTLQWISQKILHEESTFWNDGAGEAAIRFIVEQKKDYPILGLIWDEHHGFHIRFMDLDEKEFQ